MVIGNSLSPFFLPGDFVIILKSLSVFRNLLPGDTVVFTHPVYGQLIKTVLSNDTGIQSVQVKGTHPDSISSAKLGNIPYHQLLGKVILHFHPPRKPQRQ